MACFDVSSLDPGEAFDIYGSNTLGSLGTKISLGGGPYGDTNNNNFVNIPNFGSYRYVSVVAAIDDVLPWALAATYTRDSRAGRRKRRTGFAGIFRCRHGDAENRREQLPLRICEQPTNSVRRYLLFARANFSHDSQARSQFAFAAHASSSRK